MKWARPKKWVVETNFFISVLILAGQLSDPIHCIATSQKKQEEWVAEIGEGHCSPFGSTQTRNYGFWKLLQIPRWIPQYFYYLD